MGTSVSQRSPDTLNWRAAQATYEDSGIPIDRVLQEVWRAATSQDGEAFRAMLNEPIVYRLRDIAINARTPGEAARLASRAIAESKQTSLVADIALRAAVQSAASTTKAQAYSERLFAEASNYLLSRDLPGFVGTGRNSTVAESVRFKASVLHAASEAVRQVGIPKTSTPGAWQKHAADVVNRLRGKTR